MKSKVSRVWKHLQMSSENSCRKSKETEIQIHSTFLFIKVALRMWVWEQPAFAVKLKGKRISEYIKIQIGNEKFSCSEKRTIAVRAPGSKGDLHLRQHFLHFNCHLFGWFLSMKISNKALLWIVINNLHVQCTNIHSRPRNYKENSKNKTGKPSKHTKNWWG